MLQVYDRVLASRSVETLLALLILVAALFTFYGFLEFSRGRVLARIGARFQIHFNPKVFNAVLERMALRRKLPAAGNTLQDISTLRDFFSSPVLLTLFDAMWTPIFLLAIFMFHPLLGWLAMAGGGVLILIAALNQLLTRRRVLLALQQSHYANRFAQQIETGADIIWSQGMGPDVGQHWQTLQHAAMIPAISASDQNGIFTATTRAFRFFLQSAMLAMGAWLVLENALTAGAMIAVSILLGSALSPIEQGLAQWPAVQRAKTSWVNLSEILAEIPITTPDLHLPEPDANLQIKGVSVVLHQGTKPTLRNVSFTLPPGQALGVIGDSGSGKTTLARTVMGLLTPTTGEVLLGQAPFGQYTTERRGKLIGYLPQNPRLFDGTIAANIARMSQNPDSERVVKAAKTAQIHGVILGLPFGYDTPVNSADIQLSGGQIQRLALARALYHDPVVLLLDEPNSALDASGSDALNTVVAKMKATNRSVLLMTHRPTAITACDQLLILKDGHVAALGSRDEIIRANMQNAPAVRQVIQAQF